MENNFSISLRPRCFDDVYNQKGVVSELKIRAKENNWPKAMLLKGISGSGKTTLAQIIAMTINCKDIKSNGDPCCECASCKSIIEERFDRDVLVLDGGSVGGKDSVVEFMQLAEVSPMLDKKRILIIEESDQLSISAKNALHKILEKPQQHVHFILLSMVQGGLPASIMSRCQSFNLKVFNTKEIAMGLKAVMEKTGLWEDASIPDSFKLEGIMSISITANGSLREAIQYLEKCLVSKYYTREDIYNNLGIMDNVTLTSLLSKMMDMKPEFFIELSRMAIKEFFDLAYWILAEAYSYGISKQTNNEAYSDTIIAISKHKRLREVILLFDDFYKESKPYLKKEYVVSKIASWYNSKNAIHEGATTPAPNVSARQVGLDAEARSYGQIREGTELNSRQPRIVRN